MARKKNAMDDPGMKLFGRKIEEQKPLSETNCGNGQIDDQDHHPEEDEVHTPTSQLDDLGSSSGSCEDDKPEKNEDPTAKNPSPCGEKNSASMKNDGGDPDSSHQLVIQDKLALNQSQQQNSDKSTPRRPDKPVPCPRCNSMDTKFCYFNNYNVNQPRHFCKNCQRYWTAGGTLRNVPVGAGRRKSKHGNGNSSSSQQQYHHHQHIHQHHQQEQFRATNSGEVPSLKPQQQQPQQQKVARMRLPPILPAEVCHFSATAETSPSNSSMITSLNSSPNSGTSTMFNLPQPVKVSPVNVVANNERGSSPVGSSPVGKSGSVCSSKPEQAAENNEKTECRSCKPAAASEGTNRECNGCSGGMFNNMLNAGNIWPYGFPWANGPPSQGGGGGGATSPEQMQAEMASWLSNVWAAGVPAWTPFAWNMPWAFAAAFAAAASANGAGANAGGFAAAAAAAAAAASAAQPPPLQFCAPKTLGKHARDKASEGGRVEGCLWAPKTLRIDDPGEAAKSSFWTTLGLDKSPATTTGNKASLIHAGKDRGVSSQDKNQMHVNPAALSRSLHFQENN